MGTTTVSKNALQVYLNIFGRFLKSSANIVILTSRGYNMQYIKLFIVFIYEHMLIA